MSRDKSLKSATGGTVEDELLPLTWREFADCMPDHVMLLERDGTIRYINFTVPDLTREAVLGRSVFDFTPEDCREVAARILADVWSTGRPSSYDTRYIGRDGQERFFEVHVGALKNSGGEVLALLSRSTDVTLRIQAEVRERTALERRAEQARELEQANHELRRAQAQLIQAGKITALGTILSGLAHELYTPLGSIEAASQKLRRELERSAGESGRLLTEPLEEINFNLARMEKVIRRFRDFSAPVEDKPCTIDLNVVVRSALALYEERLRAAQIEVELNFAEDLPVVLGMFGRLEQLFANLISNSYDAMQQQNSDRVLRVATEVRSGVVVVRICDTGYGIVGTQLSQLFEPFYTTKSSSLATGLGLFLSHRIVEQHRGSISVESLEGEGSSFVVSLPALPPAV